MKRIWVTGFRQFELGVFGKRDPKLMVIKYALAKLLRRAVDEGADWLITGGQSGIEQWAIEEALSLQKEAPQLQIALMTPFTDFGAQWKPERQAQLTERKHQVNFTAAVSKAPYQNPSQLKQYQQFMLTHTEEAFIFYDQQADQSPVRYAWQAAQQYQEQHEYELHQIDFDRLQDYAEEYGERMQEQGRDRLI